jgi:hypothetical protein
MYYPTVVQPTSAGLWPNAYQIATPQQQAIPTVYYQVPTSTVPEVMVQQSVPTMYYPAPTMTGPPIATSTTSEAIVQQPQANSTTTTKTITTRILDPSIQTSAPVTTTTTVVPPVETTTIQERPRNQIRGLRSLSASTYSDETSTSTDSTVTPQPEPIKTNTILPPAIPIQTTTMAPVRRVIHRPYTPSGYYSSDLDYGKRKIYKTDYKYRHYYCCNICKGRFDLHNRSYGCCEWFYGCPVWALILFGLLFLALLVTFFTLLGLQPTLNSSRLASTAETRLLNRTQIVYGFYQNCGYQVNATTGTATTLILCTNTATTTTARIQLSPFYTVISGTTDYSYCRILIVFCYLSVLQISIN